MKNLPRYIDLAFCLVVLPVMMALSPIERWYHNFTTYILISGIWLYAVYFTNRAFTIPWLFGKHKKKFYGIALIILSIALTFILSCVELYIPKPGIYDAGITLHLPQVLQYQQALWTLFMIVEAFSFAVGLLTQTNIQRARRLNAEAQRDKAEIELYKTQIKPHFMFNTLNSLYGLFLTGNPNALPSLERFISMMQYIHTISNKNLVPITEEAEYIEKYVEVQSLRLNEMTTVRIDIDVKTETLMIPPMLLVTFVENCFKHGVSSIEKSEIAIDIYDADGYMTFTTSNRIYPVKRIGEHMGIENCRKRLELFFPGKYDLSIKNDGITFNVNLKIKL